jgi:hypothetical protein
MHPILDYEQYYLNEVTTTHYTQSPTTLENLYQRKLIMKFMIKNFLRLWICSNFGEDMSKGHFLRCLYIRIIKISNILQLRKS